ncbi:MAG: PAS domain S-box protein [Methanoregulaceae archaeon]|nr:PAS domain S-box protein [Methanoregulaceae archaeon]
MAQTMQGSAKVSNPIESRQWTEEALKILRILVGIGPPLLLFFVILVIVFNVLPPKYFPPTWIFEGPLLLLVMNTLFLSIIPFVVALIALRGYMEGSSVNLLFFGSGMLSFSLACFVAGFLGAQAQANANLTIHNTGILLASLFNLLASVMLYLRKSAREDGEKHNKNVGIFAYVGILIFTTGLSFATLRGYTPAFYVSGSGPTLLREVVLTAATIFFGVSCILIVVFDRDRRSFFLTCYAVGLALITVGLIALMTSKRANSSLSWLGRSAQFAAGIYFLAAVVAAVRAAWSNRWTIPNAIRDFLRPSEALYRDLVETATDAITPISTSGEILIWNTAAEKMFGYNRVEALRLVPSDLIDPEDSRRMFQEIEAGMAGTKGSYVGKLREVKARKKGGDEFPAELSFSSRRSGGGWISTLIIRDITEHKEAEKERERLLIVVREEKDRLSALINSIQDEVWFADTQKNFTLANPSALREFGLNGTTDINVNEFAKSLEVYRPDGTPRPVDEAPPLCALEGKIVTNQEEMIRIPQTGELRIRQVSATPVRDARGHIIGSVSVARDITERKKAEEALRMSEERFRSIFTSNVAAMAIWDSQGHLLDSNDRFLKLIGYTRGELEGGQVLWDEATPPEMRQRDYDAVKELQVGGDIEPYEKEFVRPDGTRVPVIIGGRILPGEQNIGVAFAVDITERKEAEEALRASEERYQLATMATNDAIWDLNLIAGTVHWNDTYSTAFGRPLETQNSWQWWIDHIHPKDRDRTASGLRAAIEGETNTWVCEYMFLRADGTWADIYDRAYIARDKSGKAWRVVGAMQDMTERKRVEEALQKRTLELQHLTETLEQRVKERTAELANLSSQLVSAQENERKRVSYDLHDNVWQTLLAIRFNIESLFSGHEDWEALGRKSKEITEDTLMAVGKIRSMQGDLWPYVLDDIGVGATINWYCREFEKNHSGFTVESRISLGEREVPSSAKIVIYRIMQEAMINVAKHSKANHVSLSLMNKDHRVEFAIVDNGIGFDPEEILAKRAPWGGLGLLTIKARTELSGGTFEIESVKGKGTTIRASWPL